MEKIVKRLGRVEVALKEAILERENYPKANEEMTQEIVKEAEFKFVWTELPKAQAYVTEYFIKEEELIWEAAEAMEDAEGYQKVEITKDIGRKHQVEIYSLNRGLKHAK